MQPSRNVMCIIGLLFEREANQTVARMCSNPGESAAAEKGLFAKKPLLMHHRPTLTGVAIKS